MSITVESCARLEIKRLFQTGRVGSGSTGSWRGQHWMIDGCFFTISDKRWRLVPVMIKNKYIEGKPVQWLMQDSTGRRCTSLFLTADGRVGSRWELGLKYKSQTLWTKKRVAHRRHKAIQCLMGTTDFQWVRDHPTYVPDRPKRMRRATYRRLRKRLTTTREKTRNWRS